MPSYKDKLTDAERADLIAYLVTLQGTDTGVRTGGGHAR